MTSDQAAQLITLVQAQQVSLNQLLSYGAAIHMALAVLCAFVIVFGLVRSVQGRPRGGS